MAKAGEIDSTGSDHQYLIETSIKPTHRDYFKQVVLPPDKFDFESPQLPTVFIIFNQEIHIRL